MAIAIVLGVVVVAIVLFWTEWVPVEVTSIAVVFLLAVTGVLTPAEAWSGFSNDTVILLFTLLAMAQGLASTGLVHAVGARLASFGRFGSRTFLLALLVATAVFSAFVSNTVTVAAFLPLAMSGAARARTSPRAVLLPVAFASMLGGTVLLFGTSTNLVMSAAMARAGLGPIGVAELAPVGIPVACAGVALLALIAPRLLRAGASRAEEGPVPERTYLAEAVVHADSPQVGKELGAMESLAGARPIAVVRGGAPLPAEDGAVLSPHDRVVLEGKSGDIAKAAHLPGVAVGSARPAAGGAAGGADDPVVVEASVPPGSPLVGRTMDDPRGRPLGVEVLAIHRRPTMHRFTKLQLLSPAGGAPSLQSLPFAVGDLLLVRGPRERVRALADGAVLLVLADVAHEPPRYEKGLLAGSIFAAVLVIGSAGLVPFAVAGLGGLLAMILTGCVDARRVFRIDWRVILLVAAMLALGLAMERSGAGRLFGDAVASAASQAGPRGVLLALMILTILLSGPMSNQAAGLVMLPIAVAAAAHLGLAPRPFAVAVTLAASCSFLTPLEPASMLVFGAGRYRFSDFVRVGLPLTVLVVAIVVTAVPYVWPFEAAAPP